MQETWAQSLGSIPGEGYGNPLQYSCQGNPTDREAWWATIHGVARVEHNLATKPAPHTQGYYSLLPVALFSDPLLPSTHFACIL